MVKKNRLQAISEILVYTLLIESLLWPSMGKAGLADSAAAGRSLGGSLIDSYTPGPALDATLKAGGHGGQDEITPSSAEAQKQKGTLSGYYSNPSAAGFSSYSSNQASRFIDKSYNTRKKYDLTNDPTFGKGCLDLDGDGKPDRDAAGKCISRSTSQDVLLRTYPDCAKTNTTTGGTTYEEKQCTSPNNKTVLKTYRFQTSMYPKIETHSNTTCASLTPPSHPGQAYWTCKEYQSGGQTLAVTEAVILTHNTVLQEQKRENVYDSGEITHELPAGNYGLTDSGLPYWGPPLYTYDSDTGRQILYSYNPKKWADTHAKADNPLFFLGGEQMALSFNWHLDPIHNKCLLLGTAEVLSEDKQVLQTFKKEKDGGGVVYYERADCPYHVGHPDEFTFTVPGTGPLSVMSELYAADYVIKDCYWYQSSCDRDVIPRATTLRIDKIKTAYTEGINTVSPGLDEAVRNCTLVGAKAFNDDWTVSESRTSDGTAASLSFANDYDISDTKLCRKLVGGNGAYDVCLTLEKVLAGFNGKALQDVSSAAPASASYAANTCSLRPVDATYNVEHITCDARPVSLYPGLSCNYVRQEPSSTCVDADGFSKDQTVWSCPVYYNFDGNAGNDAACSVRNLPFQYEGRRPGISPLWNGELTFSCPAPASTAEDTCKKYVDQKCTEYSSVCADSTCTTFSKTMRCPVGSKGTSTVAHSCPNANIRCIGTECVDNNTYDNTDLGQVAAMDGVTRQIQVDNNSDKIFPGVLQTCQITPRNCCIPGTSPDITVKNYIAIGEKLAEVYKIYPAGGVSGYVAWQMGIEYTIQNYTGVNLGVQLTGYTTTVASNGAGGYAATSTASYSTTSGAAGTISSTVATVAAYAVVALAAYVLASTVFDLTYGCRQSDAETSFRLGYKLCYEVSSHECVESIAGACTKKVDRSCCFNSMIARIVHEQGRRQLGIEWGSGEAANCRAFTQEEIQKIDFSKIDFSEYLQYVQNKFQKTLDPNKIAGIKGNLQGKVDIVGNNVAKKPLPALLCDFSYTNANPIFSKTVDGKNVYTPVVRMTASCTNHMGAIDAKWNIWDGSSHNGATVSIATPAGTYSVTLTVNDGTGRTAIVTKNLTVASP